MPCPFIGPKYFGLVQFFCARPKIYLHIVAVTNILCQKKIVEGLKIHFWKSMKTNLNFKKLIKLTSAFISDFFFVSYKTILCAE